MLKEKFRGSYSLFKFMFKNERLKIIIWVVGIVLITYITALTYPNVYKSQEEIMGFALTIQNPAMIAMMGIGYDISEYTTATTFAHEMLLLTAVAMAIMNIMLTARLSRGDEEDGRVELISSLPVGRLSYIGAAGAIIILTNFIIILLIGVGLPLLNLKGINFEGAMLYGCLLGFVGLGFAGFTFLFAQLANTSKLASGLSYVCLIIFYIIRAIGDTSNEAISMVSPLGWIGKSRVFVDNNWWPIIVSLGLSIILFGIAYYLNSLRDMGSGYLPVFKGKDQASKLLKTPIGLIVRTQKVQIITCGLGIFFLGLSFGSIFKDFETYFKDMQIIKDIIGITEGSNILVLILEYVIKMMSLFTAIPALMIVLRIKNEETKHRIDHIYSRNVSRTKFVINHLLVAMVVGLLMQLLLALGLWITGANVIKADVSFIEMILYSLSYLPAIYVFLGLAILLIGWFPNLLSGIWIYFSFVFISFYLEGLFKLPKALNYFSSFYSVPDLFERSYWSLIILMVIFCLMSIWGVITYNRRDINS
jgi:ABC-2 type transport system permease protein